MTFITNMLATPRQEQWPFLLVLERFGIAVAIGLFVGIEREYSGKLGTRTFGLIAIWRASRDLRDFSSFGLLEAFSCWC
jgi:hypothetical protein